MTENIRSNSRARFEQGKKFLTVLILSTLLLSSCTKNPSSANPTTPSVSVAVAEAAFLSGCPIAATFVTNAQVKALLVQGGLCTVTATGIANIITSKGTVAQIQALLNTFSAQIVALPSTIPVKDLQYAQGALALGQAVLTAYALATGQVL
jgi:hypothetical protein